MIQPIGLQGVTFQFTCFSRYAALQCQRAGEARSAPSSEVPRLGSTFGTASTLFVPHLPLAMRVVDIIELLFNLRSNRPSTSMALQHRQEALSERGRQLCVKIVFYQRHCQPEFGQVSCQAIDHSTPAVWSAVTRLHLEAGWQALPLPPALLALLTPSRLPALRSLHLECLVLLDLRLLHQLAACSQLTHLSFHHVYRRNTQARFKSPAARVLDPDPLLAEALCKLSHVRNLTLSASSWWLAPGLCDLVSRLTHLTFTCGAAAGATHMVGQLLKLLVSRAQSLRCLRLLQHLLETAELDQLLQLTGLRELHAGFHRALNDRSGAPCGWTKLVLLGQAVYIKVVLAALPLHSLTQPLTLPALNMNYSSPEATHLAVQQVVERCSCLALEADGKLQVLGTTRLTAAHILAIEPLAVACRACDVTLVTQSGESEGVSEEAVATMQALIAKLASQASHRRPVHKLPAKQQQEEGSEEVKES
ncbi:hypothetical protein QJQ45_006376 [Haematococcus lacustris]|nr:hypothetical protein QJQ45_006376 [Haematococcus lacustris]